MIFLLGIYILTALTSSTLAQYDYTLKRGGYNYFPPEVPFTEAPPPKSSNLQVSTSAPTFLDKTSTPTLGYIYTKPNVSFTLPTTIKISTTSKPPSYSSELSTLVPNSIGYEYALPAISFTYPAINSKSNLTTFSSLLPKTNSSSSPRPPSLLSLIPTFKTKGSVLKPPPSQTKSSGYTYPHPVIPFIIPKEEDSHPSEDPSISSIPSTNATSSPKTNGYTYTPPSVLFTIPPRIIKDKRTELPKFKGYFYPKPKVSLTLPNIFPKSKDILKRKQGIILKTQIKAYTEVSTDRSASTTSPTPSTGYSYSRPEVPFTLPPKYSTNPPSEVQVTKPTSSSSKSISSPETSPLKQSNGYVYTRPDTPFKNPPDITFTIPSSTTDTNHSPSKMLGYSYKPPKVPFTTPQETSTTHPPPSSILLKSQKQTKPVVNSNYLGPPEVGYSYPKPAIPFGF
ncbi:mucin-2 [Bactrocera oleae]|uniref:mucin-2 n=1 Tax=Bactrocera oleae TaxID=104688 RepID=UPI00387ED6BF